MSDRDIFMRGIAYHGLQDARARYADACSAVGKYGETEETMAEVRRTRAELQGAADFYYRCAAATIKS